MSAPAIAAQLARARAASGLGVRELAARAGVSPATIASAERGGDPRASTLRALVRELPGLRAHELLGLSAPPGESAAACRELAARAFGFVVGRVRYDLEIEPAGARRTRLRIDRLSRIGGDVDWHGAAHLILAGSAAARGRLTEALAVARGELRADVEDGCFVHRFRARSWPGPSLTYERVQRDGEPPAGMHEPGGLAHSAPFRSGLSFEVLLPVRVLEIRARLAGRFDHLVVRAWTDGQSLPPEEADLSERLHEVRPRAKASPDRRTFTLRVAAPMIGVHYGVGWGEDSARPNDATPRRRAPSIAKAREAAGLSQRALAARLGVSPVTVADAERGGDVRSSLLHAICAELPSLDPAALLGRSAADASLQGAWRAWRDLLGIEADEERKALVITPDGDAHALCETIRLRRVGPSDSDLRIRYSSVQALGKRLPTVLKAIEDAVAGDAAEGLRARIVARRQGRLIHEITVPRRLAQAGVSYTRRLFDARFFDPGATDDGRLHHDGAAIVPFHPVKRLALSVTFPPGRFPKRTWFGVHPRMLLDGPLPEASIAARLHPEGLGETRDEASRTLSLSVDYPLMGFIYDVFWERT